METPTDICMMVIKSRAIQRAFCAGEAKTKYECRGAAHTADECVWFGWPWHAPCGGGILTNGALPPQGRITDSTRHDQSHCICLCLVGLPGEADRPSGDFPAASRTEEGRSIIEFPSEFCVSAS